MQTFRVQLYRAVSQEAALDIPADDRGEAEEIAKQRAADGMVAWVETHAELDAMAEAT